MRSELSAGLSTEPSVLHSPTSPPQTTQTQCFLPSSKPSSSPAPAQHRGRCSLPRAALLPRAEKLQRTNLGKTLWAFFFLFFFPGSELGASAQLFGVSSNSLPTALQFNLPAQCTHPITSHARVADSPRQGVELQPGRALILPPHPQNTVSATGGAGSGSLSHAGDGSQRRSAAPLLTLLCSWRPALGGSLLPSPESCGHPRRG